MTRTPVSTKRTNRVASKNHTSGIDKKIFLSDLISRGLMGKHTEKSDQNSRKKILSTCWVNEIYQTADHPALPPVLGGSPWRLSLARDSCGFWLPHVANPPNTLAKALAWVGSDVRGEVWFGSFIQRLIVL